MSKKAPERIYLQNWDSPVGEITWCTEKVDPDVDGVEDAEYIRKDLAIAELEESQRIVSVLRNVAYEYDNNWRENSSRWQRYLDTFQSQTDKE